MITTEQWPSVSRDSVPAHRNESIRDSDGGRPLRRVKAASASTRLSETSV